MIKRLTLLLRLFALGCFSTITFAEGNEFYAGAGVGLSDVDSSIGALSFDDDDTGWKLFGGYEFSEHLAVEAFYVDLGDFSGVVLGTPVNLEVDGFGVAGVGSYPLNETFSVHGKLGIWFWDSEANAGGVAAGDDDTDIMFGLGGSAKLSDALSVRAEWERFTADSDDVDLFSINAVFKF